METTKHIEVVAAVIEVDGRLLCTQRGPNRRAYISGKWEFPGGKIEEGEAPDVALAREIREELQVDVRVGAHLLTVEHSYPDFALTMHAFRCELSDSPGAIRLSEHVSAEWLDPQSSAFAELDWAAADVPIVDQLRRERASAGGADPR